MERFKGKDKIMIFALYTIFFPVFYMIDDQNLTYAFLFIYFLLKFVLKVCCSTVVEEFAHLTRRLEVLYCYNFPTLMTKDDNMISNSYSPSSFSNSPSPPPALTSSSKHVTRSIKKQQIKINDTQLSDIEAEEIEVTDEEIDQEEDDDEDEEEEKYKGNDYQDNGIIGQGELEGFFPFDPIQLKWTKKWFDGLYREYENNFADEEEDDDEEEVDEEEDLDDDVDEYKDEEAQREQEEQEEIVIEKGRDESNEEDGHHANIDDNNDTNDERDVLDFLDSELESLEELPLHTEHVDITHNDGDIEDDMIDEEDENEEEEDKQRPWKLSKSSLYQNRLLVDPIHDLSSSSTSSFPFESSHLSVPNSYSHVSRSSSIDIQQKQQHQLSSSSHVNELEYGMDAMSISPSPGLKNSYLTQKD